MSEKISDSWMGNEWECPKGGNSECKDCIIMLDKLLWEECPKLGE